MHAGLTPLLVEFEQAFGRKRRIWFRQSSDSWDQRPILDRARMKIRQDCNCDTLKSVLTSMDAAAKQNAASRGLRVANLHSALAGPFDLEADPRRPVVITGRSGSGKSLFLRMLADLDVNEGTVTLDGQDRRAIGAPAWRTLVSYVAAESGWWCDSIGEHFPTQSRAQAVELATQVGLEPDQLSAPVARLSSGERQRWALIRAVVKRPRVLLLDEPTGALDQASVERVESFLRRELEHGTILILVTHDPGLAERMGGSRFEMVDRKLRRL